MKHFVTARPPCGSTSPRLNDVVEDGLIHGVSFECGIVIEIASKKPFRHITPAVYAQLDRLSRLCDKIYVHVDGEGSA